MSNKTEDRTYFRELIRKLRELRVSAESGDIVVPNDTEDVLEFNELELPITPDIFHKMTSEEKEALFIWLNKDTMPQA